MIAALYSTGVRRFELAGVALADYHAAARSLRIRGKWSKERMVYLTASAVGRIVAWLTVRRRDLGGLFPPSTPRGRHIRHDQQGRIAFMNARTVSNVLAARAELAGLDEAPRAHDFRRTFIGELLDAGVEWLPRKLSSGTPRRRPR
ncbi:phage integrase family protein [Nonomuraea fuscirosea]|uniref:Phage integrase family protein n=1 Tax=Nonomuraea fuscirosea TaxID=1291556 RepID=A0A2T0LNR6_9ACTN|nr:tyrosine-type recombinase/integrase [Nonomuraea fuscirosea]PRX44799.1 phage integrase family protein [Nonomuraea fuscirosea]